MDDDSVKILSEIFSIVSFSEEERKNTLLNFEKKLAADLLQSIKNELPKELRDFAAGEGAKITDPKNPIVERVREAVKKLHSEAEYRQMMAADMKKLLPQYVDFLSRKQSVEKASLLEQCIKKSFKD